MIATLLSQKNDYFFFGLEKNVYFLSHRFPSMHKLVKEQASGRFFFPRIESDYVHDEWTNT